MTSDETGKSSDNINNLDFSQEIENGKYFR